MRNTLLIALVLTAAQGAPTKPAATALPAKLQGVVGEVEAAYLTGNAEKVWHALAPSISGQKEEVLALIDEALTARKIPVSRELLVEAGLKLMLENRTAALPAPPLRERLLVLAALQTHVDEPL